MVSNINLIACVGKNGELGKDGKLVFHLKRDMKFFIEKTLGHTVIMGRNTYKSIGRALPGRTNIVISHSKVEGEDIVWRSDFDKLFKGLFKSVEYYVIGGASIYKQALPYADTIYLTEVDKSVDADVYFPEFDKTLFTKQILVSGNEDGINFNIVAYRRKRW